MAEKNIAALIIEAINSDDEYRIQELISNNRDQIDIATFMAGQTWLGYAAQKGKVNASSALISLGFDINRGDSHFGAKPICSAAANGQYDVVRLLLDAGSDLDTDASVRNPLFSAIIGRSHSVAEIILKAGMNPKIRYNSDTMKDMYALAFALMRGERACADVIARWMVGHDEGAMAKALAEADEIAERNAKS